MSGRRRRSGGENSEGRGKRLLMWAGWGIVVLLLGGNLALSWFRRDGDTPKGVITPDALQTYGFWAAVDVTAIVSAAGLVWAWRAHRQNERSSLRWAQWACGAGLFGAAFFAATAIDHDMLKGRWLALGYAVVFGVQSVFVAVFAYREYFRSFHGEGRAHDARRSAAALLGTPPVSPAAGTPPESPGTAK